MHKTNAPTSTNPITTSPHLTFSDPNFSFTLCKYCYYPIKTIGLDTVSNALRDNGYRDKQDAHGLRVVFRSYLSQIGFSVVVGELAIAHNSTGKGKIQAIYDRYDYLEERKQAYQAWGDYCEKCGILLTLSE
ncbi:hypothetical protein [Histophilus somni]|uniref:hypothetical protein n=1 Tax=Histophilus somni TaxID=731 RepID=UPI0021160CCE|nr:hypothetical protein [Histophilus somni]